MSFLGECQLAVGSSERPSRDEVLLCTALLQAERSTCIRKKVGAVIALDGRILSTGYAGSPAGTPHCTEVGCLMIPGMAGCQRTTHAELNAITYAARHGIGVQGASMYCTLSPCLTCAKAIINSGILQVFFIEQYRTVEGLSLLMEAGVKCTHAEP